MVFGLIALLIAVIVDLVLSVLDLNRYGIHPSIDRLSAERVAFSETFDRPHLLFDPRPLAVQARAKIEEIGRVLNKSRRVHNEFVDRLLSSIEDAAISPLATVEIVLLRLLGLFAIAPLVLVSALVVAIDGWVRREVRKAGAGLESARLYHLAKRSIAPLCLWTAMLYLTVPAIIDVRWAYAILVATVPVLVGATISRFKKYL